MTDHYQMIYKTQAALYDQLVRCEDGDGALLPALMALHPIHHNIIVEFGAGTGRLTRLLTPYAAKIYAFDISAHMLETAQGSLAPSVELAVGDNRQMPVRDGVAHITMAGWSFGHAVAWSPDGWRAEIGLMLAEMARITQPEGVQIIIETLGTGQAEPHAPNDQLAT
ncbi:MAG: class I SAM-dependent methyltransferase, partial [Armatimonadetes bacterium]|nr:class I SAM-dependent methyltransferase [Anaerolineae bacterium]